jgi:hypothetical protein
MGRAEIFEKWSGYCVRYHAWVDKVFVLHAPKRQWKPYVVWLWGDAGVDKSRMASAVCEDQTFRKSPDCKWWDGYSGQDVVVFDDLRKSTFTFSHLLVLLDRGACSVEYKGGMCPLLAKVIIITCSKPHDVLWAEIAGTENENLRQLSRRIDVEFEVRPDNDDAKRHLVDRMRQRLWELSDPANWDPVCPKFGKWDGKSPPVRNMFLRTRQPSLTSQSRSGLVSLSRPRARAETASPTSPTCKPGKPPVVHAEFHPTGSELLRSSNHQAVRYSRCPVRLRPVGQHVKWRVPGTLESSGRAVFALCDSRVDQGVESSRHYLTEPRHYLMETL